MFVGDLANALNRALSEVDLQAFGRAGRKRVEDHFSWDQIAQDTITVYREAIASFA